MFPAISVAGAAQQHVSLLLIEMNRRKPLQVSLSDYWQGIADALNARLKASKKHLTHQPTVGQSAESHFRDLLKNYLPSRYAVESGFVMDASGERSGQIDIIIADTFHIPPLCSEPNYKVFATESVCAVIEVTTSPRGKVKGVPKLESDVDKLALVRRLGRERDYMDIQPVLTGEKLEFRTLDFRLNGSPRCFLITSGDEWKSKDAYENNLISALKRSKEKGNPSWINAAFSMTHGLVRFTPFKEYETKWIEADPLLTFLLIVNESVGSFPTFKINIRKYAKKLPTV